MIAIVFTFLRRDAHYYHANMLLLCLPFEYMLSVLACMYQIKSVTLVRLQSKIMSINPSRSSGRPCNN